MRTKNAGTADPFRGSRAVAAGEVTWSRLRRREFVKLHPDTYVGANTAVDLGVRLRALSVWGGDGAVVAGPLAAQAWGADCPWDDEEVVVSTVRRPTAGVAVRFDRLPPEEIRLWWQVLLTSPARTAFDLARRAHSEPLPEAVAAADAVANAKGLAPQDVARVATAHPGARGLVAVRRVVELMDPGAQSLPESRLRVGLVVRGIPRPVTQYPVRRPDGRMAYLDLAWPHPAPGFRPFGLEYDGEVHRSITRHGLDLDRDADFDEVGWDVRRVTARQMADLDAVAARVRRKLGLA